MKQKNKIIIATLIIFLAISSFVLVAIVINKKNNLTNQSNISPKKTKTEESQMVKNNAIIPLTEEQKAKIASTKNIKSKINAIDANAIEVIINGGEKLILKIPSEGANIISQTIQKDGSFLDKSITIDKIPKNKEVDIQYNGSTNEIMLIVVR